MASGDLEGQGKEINPLELNWCNYGMLIDRNGLC